MTTSPAPRAGWWLFVASIFASAFLIFLIQPMVGKRILPWFGGAPAAWALCLAFYQSALFLGYVYAHLLIRFARPSLQLGLHAVVVSAALFSLPVLPSDAWKPEAADEPITRILALLVANVALPFIVLASTGPLVQAWFFRCHPRRSPYPLYAVSNIGSLLALLAYPVWIEPRFPLSAAGTFWSIAFAPTAAALLGCAMMARRTAPDTAVSNDASGDAVRIEPTPMSVAFWLALPGAAVVMLMGVTNKLCLEVASVPFLWVLLLVAYLVTFVLCFASERTYRRIPYAALFALGVWLTMGGSFSIQALDFEGRSFVRSLYFQIPSYSLLLFAGCMIMHGELYRLRPPARSLTSFYLCVSGGGALGGLFVGLLAPLLFSDYFEFELGLALVLLLLLGSWATDRSSILSSPAPAWRRVVAGVLTVGVLGLGGWQTLHVEPTVRCQERNFFGVLRVLELGRGSNAQHQLFNGSTLHGVQFLGAGGGRSPTSYYGRATGVGMALDLRARTDATRIGVIGLGVGTLAAYGRTGDLMRFYEIDPAVVHIARDSGDFSFLKHSLAKIEVVLGDARLALAEEQAQGVRQGFDMLIVDAFSGDAIPIHLLTREAFEHYLAALAPDGLVAIHVSNRHFNLFGLVGRMGLEVGLESLQILTRAAPMLTSKKAGWVLLARDRRRLADLDRKLKQRHHALGVPPTSISTARTTLADVMHVPVWTDDYSDLFSLLSRTWVVGGDEFD